MESSSEVVLKQDQELEFDELAELAESCRTNIVYYFRRLRRICIKYSSESINHEGFKDGLEKLSKKILSKLPLYIQDDELIQSKHYRIVTDESFAIGLANFCVKHHISIICQIEQQDVEGFIDYIDLLLNNYFDRIFNASSPPDHKTLIRSWLIKDLNRTSVFELKGMITGIERNPPYQLYNNELGLFDRVRNSSVIAESVEKFIQDILEKGSAPFQDVEEGRRLIYNTFAWAITSPNVLFAGLMTTTHGFSTDSYLFINSSYAFCDDLGEAMRLLTLLHECFHIYKRLGNNKPVRSPINSFIIHGESGYRCEDGHRYIEFLLPNKGEVLFANAALFLCKPANWNLSLSEFQVIFNDKQRLGKNKKSPSLMFSENAGSGQWPICLRDPTLEWLRH